MSENTLTIDLNEEYKIKIEDADKLSLSYFKKIYEKAGKAAEDILRKSKDSDNNCEKRRKGCEEPILFARQKEEYNNIIAFCGERGTGKSSAMITFAQSLVEIKKTNEFYDKTGQLKDYSFHYLDVIDPSMFEDNEHVFEVILSQLFSSFTKELNKNKETDHDKKREVLELFQQVYENLKTVQKNGDKYNGEALETLSKLACGANLRNNFSSLVQKYLDFIKPCKDDKPCLIIPIDDFDLNVKAVAVMAEQIRKYLMIPNVIILMAADIKQLSDAKEQSVRTEFETLIKVDGMTESPKAITAKYILKLIPEQRRLVLPSIKIEGKASPISVDNSTFYKDEDKASETPEELILRVINEKTGLIFLKPQYQLSYFVPRSLRGLRSFLAFLNNLSVIEDKSKDKAKNLEIFKENFISNWCNEELDTDYLEIIKKWLDLEFVERNKFIITNSYDILRDSFAKKFSNKSEKIDDALKWYGIASDSLLNILAKDNNPINISLGDVLFAIKQIEFINDIELNKFCFSIKALYSIEMLGLLNVSFNWKNEESKRGLSQEHLALEDLFKIIGGQLIPENGNPLIVEDSEHIGFDILPRQIKTINGNNKFFSRQSYNIKYKEFVLQNHNTSNNQKDIDKSIKGNNTINFDSFINNAKRDFHSYEKQSDTNNDKLIENLETKLLFQFFLIHLGSANYEKRRKEENNGYYNSYLYHSKNIREKAKFDIFTIIWTSIYPENIWRRNGLDPKVQFKTLFKSMIDERRKGRLLFPIYSVDLINEIFEKNTYTFLTNENTDFRTVFMPLVLGLVNNTNVSISNSGIATQSYNSWFFSKKYEHVLKTVWTEFQNNRITITKKDEIIERFKDLLLIKYKADGFNALNSFNVMINALKREINSIFEDTDKKVLDEVLKSIENCKISLKDIDPNIPKRGLVSSKNESSLNKSEDEKRGFIDKHYEILKSVFDE